MLDGTVKVPGVGPVQKKYVAVAAGGVAVFVAFMYLRAARSAPATTDADYGTEPEQAYEDPYASTAGLTSSTTPAGSVITNNVQWANAAVQALVDIGVDPLVAANAIGQFLARLDLTAAQADLVRQALALVGDPPVGTYTVRVVSEAPGSGGGEVPTLPGGSDPGTDDGSWQGVGGKVEVPPSDAELWDGVPAPEQGPFITPEGVRGYVFPMHNTAQTVHYWFENDGQHLKEAQPVGNRIGDDSPAVPSGKPTLTSSKKYKDAIQKGPGYIPGA